MAGKPWERYQPQSTVHSGPWDRYKAGGSAPSNVQLPNPETDEPGEGEATLRGLEQGATLGFGDEINGGLSTLLDSVTGQNKDLSILDDYLKQRDDSRAKFKAAEDAHPVISGVANFAGALAPALLTGGGSLAEEGLMGAVKTGATMGAVQGYGNSNSDNIAGQAKDALVGGVTGSVVGGALHGLGQAIAPAKDAASAIGDLNSIQNMKEAFNQGFTYDRNLVGKTANKTLNSELIDQGDSIAGDLQNALNQAKINKTNRLAGAGDNVDMAPWLKQFNTSYRSLKQQYGADPKTLEELKYLHDLVSRKFVGVEDESIKGLGNTWNAADVEDFLRQVGKYGSAGKSGFASEPASELVNRMVSPLDREPNMVDRYMGLENGFSPLQDLVANARPAVSDVDGNVVAPGVSDLNDTISTLMKAKDKLPDISDISNLEKANVSGAKSTKQVEDFLGLLPDEMADKYGDKLTELGKAKYTADAIAAPGLQKGLLSDTARGTFYGGANWSGLALRRLYNATPETIKSLASAVRGSASNSQVAQQLGSVLEQASGKDQIGRNALMFAVQQNPAYRELLRQFVGDPESQP